MSEGRLHPPPQKSDRTVVPRGLARTQNAEEGAEANKFQSRLDALPKIMVVYLRFYLIASTCAVFCDAQSELLEKVESVLKY